MQRKKKPVSLRARYRKSGDRITVTMITDPKLWYWVKITAAKRGATISTLVESLLLMFKDQESEWKGIIDRYIDSLLEEEQKRGKGEKSTKRAK